MRQVRLIKEILVKSILFFFFLLIFFCLYRFCWFVIRHIFEVLVSVVFLHLSVLAFFGARFVGLA